MACGPSCDAAKGALSNMDERRKVLAFDANAQGGDAKKRAQRAEQKRAAQVAEIETSRLAIIEASRRIEDARRDEELAELGIKAERALVIRERLARRAVKLEPALATLAEEANEFQSELRELNHTVGCTLASRTSNCNR